MNILWTTDYHKVRSLDLWGFLFTLILLAKLFVGTMSITIMYADDTQLYVDFDPTVLGEKEKALNILTSCIDDIIVWMRRNKLKLNAEKNEFFVAASKNNLSHVQDVSLIIGNSTVTPSTNIRNLGVMFDPVMSMSSQVNSICSSTNYHLRNIARIRKNIDRDTCHHVVRCLVTSRLDYCNSLVYGITKAHLKRLTGIQYRAAKLVLAVNCWRALWISLTCSTTLATH